MRTFTEHEQKNFQNSNEVFAILDLIRREIKKNNFNRDRDFFGKHGDFDTDDVKSVNTFRDSSDNLTGVHVKYFDGTEESVVITRGFSPPVPDTVEDYEYINTQLIMGIEINIVAPHGTKAFKGRLIREDGYGRVTGLEMDKM